MKKSTRSRAKTGSKADHIDILSVVFSGSGQGEIAACIKDYIGDWCRRPDGSSGPVVHIDDSDDLEQTSAANLSSDVAICTTGRMRVAPPGRFDTRTARGLMDSNFLLPRAFVERQVKAMIRDKRRWGHVIVLGSNVSWYGNVCAEDYAAGKAALRKYLELRAKSAKESGIRISLLDLGGVETSKFWSGAFRGAPEPAIRDIGPRGRKMLRPVDVAAVVTELIGLPGHICLRNALLVSTEYQ